MESVEQLFRDVDPEQYEEWIFLLESRYSRAAFIPSESLTLKLLQNLPTARIRRRCGCNQSDCNTYDFIVGDTKPGTRPLTIRFSTSGEALLHVDDAGTIYSAERLIEECEDIKRFELVEGNWVPVSLVNVKDSGRTRRPQ
jgi:hypothetical protein